MCNLVVSRLLRHHLHHHQQLCQIQQLELDLDRRLLHRLHRRLRMRLEELELNHHLHHRLGMGLRLIELNHLLLRRLQLVLKMINHLHHHLQLGLEQLQQSHLLLGHPHLRYIDQQSRCLIHQNHYC